MKLSCYLVSDNPIKQNLYQRSWREEHPSDKAIVLLSQIDVLDAVRHRSFH